MLAMPRSVEVVPKLDIANIELRGNLDRPWRGERSELDIIQRGSNHHMVAEWYLALGYFNSDGGSSPPGGR